MTPYSFYTRRNSLRRPGYDYSQPGEYFVTLYTKNGEYIFGNISNGIMHLNSYGEIAASIWIHIPLLYPNVMLDEFIVMPNHLHGIIILKELENSSNRNIKKPSLSEIVRRYKYSTTRKINHIRQIKGVSIWHRGFYDQISRGKSNLIAARKYIRNNPKNWHPNEEDQDFWS